jgi:glycosyltransferase involved in cell wall biosynthesis
MACRNGRSEVKTNHMNWLGTTQMVAGRFSVVVPSFQQGEFLERTLRSILDQDDKDVEIIVQDGGSTDQSLSILHRYADRVRWESKSDGGQTAAINEGFQKSSGEYLCYLNSDDMLYPGALGEVREFFAARPEAMVVYGFGDFIDDQNRLIAPYPVEPWDYARLRETCFICQPACFFRRLVLERFGPFDQALRYAMDYEYWLRVGAAEGFHFLPRKLAGSRCHARAKTFGQAATSHRETLSVLRRYHHGRIPPQWIIAYARHCGEERLRENDVLPWRWTKFAFSYWFKLFNLAPRVTPRGLGMLVRKLGPPYPSARRRAQDQIGYFKLGLLGDRHDTASR